MKFLNGKKFLIIGLLNKYSIAYGIAKSMYLQGAKLAFTYKNKKLKNKILKIIKNFNSDILLKCNFKNDKEIKKLPKKLKKYNFKINGIIHAVAYLKLKFLNRSYLDGIVKKSFIKSHLITSYSFSLIAKVFYKHLKKNSTLLTISYLGSKRILKNYNFMGLAKASLESSVRYLSLALGPKIRVNAISPGPIKTASTYKIKNFNKLLLKYKNKSSLKKNVTLSEIGDVAVFLSSYLSRGITGQIIYVDGGFNNVIN
ncbi:SDR family oxidoreductase [Buchnera aphidicola]|uniref:enoyl-ACP reductase FabI n=1 Tax=Buchnera aphidicola TaxID=9 RepID=UPI0030EEA4E0